VNRLENWFCGSSLWRYVTRRQLLPWVLDGSQLGDHLLELGAGPGAATMELAQHVPRVTSLEYDHALAVRLGARVNHAKARVIQGDAAALPFANASFSSAIAILMLHHLKSLELQDYAFAEIFRVLRPRAIFLAFDIPDGWTHRIAHFKSTFVPIDPATVNQRLKAAGFSKVTMGSRSGAFRVRALRSE
jgi:ubiquinone/menaquinone biosynthesis C-methylase UbiE